MPQGMAAFWNLITISWLAKRDSVCLTADVHDDDVRTDLLNVFVGDAYIRFCGKEIKKFIAAGDKYFADLPAALVKFQVGDPSKLFAVPHIYYVFTFQFGK